MVGKFLSHTVNLSAKKIKNNLPIQKYTELESTDRFLRVDSLGNSPQTILARINFLKSELDSFFMFFLQITLSSFPADKV